MGSAYLFKIRFTPNERGEPTGEWLRFDGHCDVEEIAELQKSEELKSNSHPTTSPSLNP